MTYNDGQRWIATASTLVTEAVMGNRDSEKFASRFWSKVNTYGECWVWEAALSSEGYGNFYVYFEGREHTVRAHRVAWMLTHGEIPEELFLDHRADLCQGRWCVNPAHMELVTPAENTRRGTGAGRLSQRADRDAELSAREIF